MPVKSSELVEMINSQVNLSASVEESCIAITNDEGIEAFLTIGEQQIVVEALLFPVSSAQNINALNDRILRSMHLLPLTSISIKTFADEDYYVAFGALSAESKMCVVIEEIETLFANIDDFIELYADFILEVN